MKKYKSNEEEIEKLRMKYLGTDYKKRVRIKTLPNNTR